MRRREFVQLAVGVTMTWPLAARAQQKAIPVIGWLDESPPPTPDRPSPSLASFQRGLGDLGYKDGKNYGIEARFADTDASRLPVLAKELVNRGVDIIVTIGTPAVRAAREATATIPIVMAGSNNPVEQGLVASLAHPGGNVTGLTHNAGPEITAKGLQLLKGAAPNISRVAILFVDDPSNAGMSTALSAAKADLSITLLFHDVGHAQSAAELDAILSKIKEEHADAVFVFPEFLNNKYSMEIINFLSINRLPAAFQNDFFVRQGGLLSYYTDFLELRRLAAGYVDKILKGARPVDLPVQQPTKFELVINLKTARALGLTVPQFLLAQADEVIE